MKRSFRGGAFQAENTFEKMEISVIMETWSKAQKAFMSQVYSSKVLTSSHFSVSSGFNRLFSLKIFEKVDCLAENWDVFMPVC